MLYLISQIILLLALASILSGLIGWLLRAFQSDKRERYLEQKLHSSQGTVPSMQRALAAAHYEIDRRENDIHRLRRKIAEIDSNPANFRPGDLDNLNGVTAEEQAHELVRERAVSGNSQFRSSDFDNGVPVNTAQEDQAVEYLNTRVEDTDGKYRSDDFTDGQPATGAEHRAANKIDAARQTPETYYRDGDFANGAPNSAKEHRQAEEITQLREENKAERQAEREYRRVLVLELDKADAALVNAQQEANDLKIKLGQNESLSSRKINDLEHALSNAHGVIHDWEKQISDLTGQIKAIDTHPSNFRKGDLDHLNVRTAEDITRDLYVARVTSGNSKFRASDFIHGIPATAKDRAQAVEYLNNRMEDTDGKYRSEDFPGGQPATPAEQRQADQLSGQRVAPQDHYREGDFAAGTPNNEAEKLYASKIRQLRKENKPDRNAAKEERQRLVKELNQANTELNKSKREANELRYKSKGLKGRLKFNKSLHQKKVTDLQTALADAQQQIDSTQSRVTDLQAEIQSIDNSPKNFREDDLANLDEKTAEAKIVELQLERVNSGNSVFRLSDFVDGVPVTTDHKLQAIEFLNTRDEDTEGKYRDNDFASGTPVTDAEQAKAKQLDAERSEPAMYYRDDDFTGDKPQTEQEKQLAAEIKQLRDENKEDRKSAKKHRHALSLELGKANEALDKYQSEAAELKKQLNENNSATDQKITGLESALADAQSSIKDWEGQVNDLSEQIKSIDNNTQNFRQGDLEDLAGKAAEEKIAEYYAARATSGNTHFRDNDFANGAPQTEAEQQRAVEYIKVRDEDTDGKYRSADFPNGHPHSIAEQSQAGRFDAMRAAPESHFRASDFAENEPHTWAEKRYAEQLKKQRNKNKALRKSAKKHRRDLTVELEKANQSLTDARLNADKLTQQFAQSDKNNTEKFQSVEAALANSHKVIEKQEKQIEDLNQKIKAIDNDAKNFRDGDFSKLDSASAEKMIDALHLARVNSGNTGFRQADFFNGIPMTDAEKLRAVEYMNTRDEDTDGKYRDGDFANGTPQTAAEKELSAKIDAMREEMEKHYRATDFEGDKPKSEEEIKLAATIDILRAKNKTARKLAKRQRKELTDDLSKANQALEEARQNADKLTQQLESSDKHNSEKFQQVEGSLSNAHDVIEKQEKQIEALGEQIKEIDNDPKNFREGDLANLFGIAAEDKVTALHLARIASGNTGFRHADFNNGIPMTEAEKLRAIAFMNNRDEDTDGKYRDGDFANGTPQTAAEKELSAKIDEMREEMQKHYRANDFEGDKPKSEEEIKLAATIDVMRAKNKTHRKLAKERRKDLVSQLETSKSKLDEARVQIDQLNQQISARPSPEKVTELESALTEANGVIERRETRISDLETKIEEIDTDPNHFRAGDMDNLNGQSALERAMEIAIARATSGNSQFRGVDFGGRIPLTEEEKKQAIEFLASRDEDTDGKYRSADFNNGEPKTAAELAQAASIDGMRTEPEKHYRDGDFEGEKPKSESEIKLAARIDVMRTKNKAYRSAAKKQRKVLKQDLANAREEQKRAREAAAELENRLNGVTSSNARLEDIIATLKEDVGTRSALEKQAGKKAEELAIDVDKLERELTRVTHDGHKKAGDLESELRHAKEDLNKAEQDAKLTKQALQSAQTTLAERITEREKLQDTLAQFKTDLALANSELSQSKQEVIRLSAEKDREIHELKMSLNAERDSKLRLEEDLDKIKRDLHAALNDDSERASREALEIQKAASEARVLELEAVLREHTTAKNENWDELKKDLENLTVAMQRKDSDLRSATTQLVDLQGNLAEYEASDGELRNRIEVLESMLAEQRMLNGKSMTSRIREIEAMLSAERRKVESMTLESNITDAASYTETPRVVSPNRFNKKSH